MKLRLQKATSTPTGLVMGVQIRGPRDSWVRFAVLEVPWEHVPGAFVQDYLHWSEVEDLDYGAEEPLPLDWQ